MNTKNQWKCPHHTWNDNTHKERTISWCPLHWLGKVTPIPKSFDEIIIYQKDNISKTTKFDKDTINSIIKDPSKLDYIEFDLKLVDAFITKVLQKDLLIKLTWEIDKEKKIEDINIRDCKDILYEYSSIDSDSFSKNNILWYLLLEVIEPKIKKRYNEALDGEHHDLIYLYNIIHNNNHNTRSISHNIPDLLNIWILPLLNHTIDYICMLYFSDNHEFKLSELPVPKIFYQWSTIWSPYTSYHHYMVRDISLALAENSTDSLELYYNKLKVHYNNKEYKYKQEILFVLKNNLQKIVWNWEYEKMFNPWEELYRPITWCTAAKDFKWWMDFMIKIIYIYGIDYMKEREIIK